MNSRYNPEPKITKPIPNNFPKGWRVVKRGRVWRGDIIDYQILKRDGWAWGLIGYPIYDLIVWRKKTRAPVNRVTTAARKPGKLKNGNRASGRA